METNVKAVLAERAKTHGSFSANANCSQDLKAVVAQYGLECDLTNVQAEALDNICQKIARILTGNPNHVDSWVDIAGYATLAAECIDGTD